MMEGTWLWWARCGSVFHFDTSSFFLAIYGDGGIQYLGTYKNSQDTGQDDDSAIPVSPQGKAVSVTWG